MFCCGATASRTAPLITQTVEHGHNPVLTSQYTHTFGSATLFEARAGGIYIRDNFTPVSDDFITPGRTDQATGFSSVNAPDRQQAVPQPDHRRCVGLAQRQRLPERLARLQVRRADRVRDAAHASASASATCRTPISTPRRTWRPSAIRRRRAAASAPPAATLQDNWTLNDRVTLNLGVRYDHIRGDIPELSAGATLDGISGDASFEVPNSITYPGVEDLISFNTLSPRLGLTLRADKSGKTVVKANYGRFYGKLATSMFNSMSPGATPTTTLRYNTATRAYDIPFSFVDNRINFSVNPDLQNQYTDQLFVGLERAAVRQHGRQPLVRLEGGEQLHPPAGRARHATRSAPSSTPSKGRRST